MKDMVVVGRSSSEDDLHKDASLLSLSHLIIKLDSEYVSNNQTNTEEQLISFHPEYAVNRHHSDTVFMFEENRDADHQTHEVSDWFPQREEESGPVSQKSHQEETAVNFPFRELLANAESCFHQMTCEADYMVNSSFLGKVDAESGQNDCSYLICETGYIANSYFSAKNADEDRNNTVRDLSQFSGKDRTFPVHLD